MPAFEDIASRYFYNHKAIVDKSKLIDVFKRIELISKEKFV